MEDNEIKGGNEIKDENELQPSKNSTNIYQQQINEMIELQKKEDHSFFSGALCGAAVVVIALLCLWAYLSKTQGFVLMKIIDQSQSVSAATGETEAVIDDELLSKLSALESCVNEYFLFDTDGATAFKDGIYKGFMEALNDPYSCYYTAEEYDLLMESTSGSYSGIGVTVSQNAETKVITVVKPFEGAPGAEAGMLPGDIVTQVDGKDISGLDINTVVSYIKGEEGTTVKIQVYRESDNDYHELTVTRAKIEVPTVEYEMLSDNIGYVQVTEFDDVTADQYIEAVDKLKSDGMEALIVDIRDNPGGLLDVVVKMLDYMLPEGTIVYTEDKNGEGDTYTSDAEHYFDLPLAVLVNGNSASASEIFSGAIKDYGIGTIVGTQTFGKGIVQNVLPFSDGSAIKLTVSRYFTPSGVCIHGVGIAPDIEVDLDEDLKTQISISHEDDNQLQEAIKAVKEKIDK